MTLNGRRAGGRVGKISVVSAQEDCIRVKDLELAGHLSCLTKNQKGHVFSALSLGEGYTVLWRD